MNTDIQKRYPTIAVLLGGESAEKEVSIASGTMVLEALKKLGFNAYSFDPAQASLQSLLDTPPSISMIMLHGGAGENGQLQAWHELHQLPYTGSNSTSCMLAMHKNISKVLWRDAHLRTPSAMQVASTEILADIMRKQEQYEVSYPLVIKPEDGGSSVHLFVATNEQELQTAWHSCQTTNLTFLFEEYIEGEEYTVSMLAGQILPSIRITTTSGMYDYYAKYQADTTEFHFDTLTKETEVHLQTLAHKAFRTLGVYDWGRVDCIKRGDEFYFLEANLVPGMTDHSLLPAAAAYIGITYDEVVMRILTGKADG